MGLLREKLLDEESQVPTKKPGWKAMPYILGNDTVERLATFGMQANLTMYLMKVYNMDQVFAANIINTWYAITNVLPVLGGFLADAYFGKFSTIAIASFASLMGMVVVMLTTWVPHIHPTPCSIEQQLNGVCKGHTTLQLTVLLIGLFLLSIGTGGIRPCSIPFAIDQFDLTTVDGRRGTTRFFNVYYTTQTLIMLLNQTLLVYIMDSVSWTLGYGLPVMFMLVSIFVFFAGTRVYDFVQPQGSIFSKISQVIVAAVRKRRLCLRPPTWDNHEEAFYDSPLNHGQTNLLLTHNFRWLNKAALIDENEMNMDESKRDPWRLCSIQQVEELKCLLKMIPIWLSTIIIFLPVVQQSIFPVSQALKMDRNLAHNFQMHPASVSVITMLTIGVFLPLYDQILAPALEKLTKQEGGLTVLQRVSLGHGAGILAMIVAGFVEIRRRNLAIALGSPDGVAPMSVLWLAPQSMLIGCIHVFGEVGHTAFFNRESPDGMRSISNSLLCLNVSFASNLSNVIINIVHNFTAKKVGQHDWLYSDINKGRLEYFYFIIAGLMMLNMCYFIFCARRYTYKVINLRA
ncbi:hypothetical protein PIB30_006784 [Stylosanthes scabra]|uniref:Uncharacterized protein n=1 Tax=Stylosanthes scabra TaxID=79078 RepID=A0ABU6U365_9FABA|nr:hypothetical protein [Stylosanthes scabra]